MRHRGTKASQPGAVHGYDWYDPESGAIDLCCLASQVTRVHPAPSFCAPPPWLSNVDVPASLPNASALDLARLEARARRAFVHDAASVDPQR
ncbi:MAG: hypothetical protein KUG77_15795 [Nannocystaceae bacterium]|nr:hypothetical protein [Nannocystaceae bacterium]